MKSIAILWCTLLCTPFFAQEEEGNLTQYPQEIGVDGYFSVGNLGGTFTLGLKYGFKFGEEDMFIAGPALRIQRSWSNQNGVKYNYNILGLGGFFHARFYNVLFAGMELEVMNAPTIYNINFPNKKLTPTCFVGGGYSQQFDTGFRFNLGVFYDDINNPFSPFRPYYIARQENGVLIPIMYRMALFFPIGGRN
jgi:hypothetical protein